MADSVNYSRPGSITMQSGAMNKIGHINSPKYGLKVPDMNVNHGWKIHGDLVADLTREEAFAKIGLETTDSGAKIVDRKAYDAFNSRLSKIGIDPANIPNTNVDFGESFLISRRIEEVGSHSSQMVNGRPMMNLPQYNRFYSDPLDALSMMEVFHENETQYKASAKYGDGRSFTGYTQSIENRDKLITSLESRLGDRLQDINPTILGGHQTEGATQLSQKITGRFTTEYTDIPGAGGTMDWSSQNPAASKGQAAIDNVMATNPEMRPYIHTGVIGDESAANLQKLTSDFPVFDEMLHGPKGYVSPYGTIEDTFSQQGYDYKTGAAVKSAPVTPQAAPVTPQGTPVPPPASPSPKPVAAISQRRLEALEEMAQNGTEHEAAAARLKLEQIRAGQGAAPPPPPRGPTIGTPTNVTTGASAQGPRAGKPIEPAGAARVDTTLIGDAEKATMSGVKGGEGISVVDAGLGATIKSNPGLTAREAIGTIGKEIKTFTKAQGKVDRKIAGHELSSAVAAGFKESKNLRLLGLGALVGVGYGASRVMHRNNNSDLQR
jgi:hypothetical protein